MSVDARGSVDVALGSTDVAHGSIDMAPGSIDVSPGSIDVASGSTDVVSGSDLPMEDYPLVSMRVRSCSGRLSTGAPDGQIRRSCMHWCR